MTPIERIRQNREMVQLSREMKKPKQVAQPFPRNALGLSMVACLAMPLIYKAVTVPSVSNILGYGLGTLALGAGVLSLSVGQRKHAIYDGKFVARAAIIPFKMIGAALLGLAAAGLTGFQGGSLAQAGLVFPVVAALSVLSFGIDPLKSKGLETVDERHIYKLEKLAASVGSQMDRLKKAASPLAVPDVMVEIAAFDTAVNRLLCAVTSDPARANSLRKLFTVYLAGVADAAQRFAAVYRGTGSPEAKTAFIETLQKFTQVFDQKAQAYSAAGAEMLEVEIKVLDDYLAREATAA